MTKTDWIKEFGERKFLPFDEQKYQQCISTLGRVASQFLKNHSDKRIVSFVDNTRAQSTHQEMLDIATTELNGQIEIERYLKRDQARTEPTDYILSKLT